MATKFVFLILPDVHLMDLAGPDQTILESIDFGADFEIEYCGLDTSITSTAGLQLAKQKHFSKIKLKAGDYLFFPGSNVTSLLKSSFKSNKKLQQWIRDAHEQKVNLVSICAGAFILGECGLLNGVHCTTHFKRTEQLQKMYPLAMVKENILFTEDNGIYTSAGIASGIDLTLHIVEKLKGSYFAHKVARELVIYNRRDGENKQLSAFMDFRNHIHGGIHKAQDFVIENIRKKIPLSELAEIACMSERNFTRVFKKETGITVNDFIHSIRKEKIQSFIKNPDLSKKQIAREVGLDSERQVSRILQS